MMLQDIILDTPWCHHIETTKTDGRILLITTKANLQDALAGVDSSFEPLFTCYLPKKPCFWLHSEYALPICTDCIQPTTTNDYATKLASSIPNHKPTGKDKDKFSKFPTKPHTKQPRYSFDDKQFPTLNQNNTSNLNNNNTCTNTATATNTHPTKATNKVMATKNPCPLRRCSMTKPRMFLLKNSWAC